MSRPLLVSRACIDSLSPRTSAWEDTVTVFSPGATSTQYEPPPKGCGSSAVPMPCMSPLAIRTRASSMPAWAAALAWCRSTAAPPSELERDAIISIAPHKPTRTVTATSATTAAEPRWRARPENFGALISTTSCVAQVYGRLGRLAEQPPCLVPTLAIETHGDHAPRRGERQPTLVLQDVSIVVQIVRALALEELGNPARQHRAALVGLPGVLDLHDLELVDQLVAVIVLAVVQLAALELGEDADRPAPVHRRAGPPARDAERDVALVYVGRAQAGEHAAVGELDGLRDALEAAVRGRGERVLGAALVEGIGGARARLRHGQEQDQEHGRGDERLDQREAGGAGAGPHGAR